jgi:hypothetical protein
MKERNDGMFGGAESKDPNMAEYGEGAGGGDPAQESANKLQGSAAGLEKAKQEAAAFIGKLAAEDAKKPPLLESPRLVKIPIDWGRRFAIAYDNGATVEYGLGKMGVPPAGAKPLHYLMEALE